MISSVINEKKYPANEREDLSLEELKNRVNGYYILLTIKYKMTDHNLSVNKAILAANIITMRQIAQYLNEVIKRTEKNIAAGNIPLDTEISW